MKFAEDSAGSPDRTLPPQSTYNWSCIFPGVRMRCFLVSEQERGQGRAGLPDLRIVRREELEQADQVHAGLVAFLARGPPHHAEQPVERLLDPARHYVDVGHPRLGLDVAGAFSRVPAGLGLVVGADPADQVALG